MSEDEYENVPGDFAALEHVDWDVVLGDQPNAAAPRRSPAPTNSSQYFEDELDEGLLSQLDVLEASLTQPPQARELSPTGHRDALRDTPTPALLNEDSRVSPTRSSRKRRRFLSPSSSRSPEKDNNDDRLLQAFSSYEDAMTCPICFDFFVAPVLVNPCGHSFCALCADAWFKNNKNGQCAVCRTPCRKRAPFTQNITLGSIVEHHIQTLGYLGLSGWVPGGSKRNEWQERNAQARKTRDRTRR